MLRILCVLSLREATLHTLQKQELLMETVVGMASVCLAGQLHLKLERAGGFNYIMSMDIKGNIAR